MPVVPSDQGGKGVKEVATGVLGQALQRYGASRNIAEEALQLVAPMRRDLGVGMQGCDPFHWEVKQYDQWVYGQYDPR